jgi:hypothetical protein
MAPLRFTCAFSSSKTLPSGNAFWARMAAVLPALPPPTTTTSTSVTRDSMGSSHRTTRTLYVEPAQLRS